MKFIKLYISRLAGLAVVPALCLTLLLMASNPASALYDFESLVANNMIDGQDGWEDQTGRTAIIVEDRTAVNGTQIVRPSGVARNNIAAFLTHINDTNFGTVAATGSGFNCAWTATPTPAPEASII